MNTIPASDAFVIGRDLGPAGRLVRTLAGLLNLAAAAAVGSAAGPISAHLLWQAGLAFAVTALAYTAVVAAVGPRLFGRIDPWVTAIVVVLPLAVLFALPGVPDPVTVGAFAFIGISQLVQAVIGYGGCEIVGIPTLLLRRRYTVYCALNGADAVELWLRSQPRWIAWLTALGAFLVTMLLGGAADYLGSALGFFAAYMAFLLIGLAVSRALAGRVQPTTIDPQPGLEPAARGRGAE